MRRLPYFDQLIRLIALFDDELLVQLLDVVRDELARRAKFDAANYVARARQTVADDVARLAVAASAPKADGF